MKSRIIQQFFLIFSKFNLERNYDAWGINYSCFQRSLLIPFPSSLLQVKQFIALNCFVHSINNRWPLSYGIILTMNLNSIQSMVCWAWDIVSNVYRRNFMPPTYNNGYKTIDWKQLKALHGAYGGAYLFFLKFSASITLNVRGQTNKKMNTFLLSSYY